MKKVTGMRFDGIRVARGLILGVLLGCGNPALTPMKTTDLPAAKPTSETARDKKFQIAVIPKGTLHEFWKSIHAGAIKAERELGYVQIKWQGPQREDDKEQQIGVVENVINAGFDAIVLAPLDRKSLVRPVELAKRKGIPVVIIDSDLERREEIAVSYVATDNYRGGVIAARRLGGILAGQGNIVVLRYQIGSASTEQREAGFSETLTKEFPGMKIVSADQYSGATREGALTAAENLLTRLDKQVQGWFCPCEPVTYGTLRALEKKGLAGKVKVVGFDATKEMVEALRTGTLDALVLQDPVNMGYLGVKTALAALEGKKINKVISTGEILLTKENLDLPGMREFHSPDLTRWLGSP